MSEYEEGSSWNMAELTTREIRKWMSLFNAAFVEGRWTECYKYALIEFDEIYPLISEQFKSKVDKYKLIEKRDNMVRMYLKHKLKLSDKFYNHDVTEFINAMSDLNLSLRQAMADTGLMMAKPSDVLGTFARRNK